MLYFLIPTYNDANNIQSIISKTEKYANKKGYDFRLYFLNDNSTDNIKSIVSSLNNNKVVLNNFDSNRGPGAVIRDGLKEIYPKLKEDDIVIA